MIEQQFFTAQYCLAKLTSEPFLALMTRQTRLTGEALVTELAEMIIS
jgi:hypothetical protein